MPQTINYSNKLKKFLWACMLIGYNIAVKKNQKSQMRGQDHASLLCGGDKH